MKIGLKYSQIKINKVYEFYSHYSKRKSICKVISKGPGDLLRLYYIMGDYTDAIHVHTMPEEDGYFNLHSRFYKVTEL